MKFYFYKNITNLKEYAVRLIENVLSAYMVTSPSDADYTLVSLCDISEIGDIAKAKKIGLPVITGGMISEYPIVNELSDFTYHGEIYGLRDHLDAGGKIEDCKFITSRGNKKLLICQFIDWGSNPIVKVGARAMYYYVSKGCPVKCKYCYMANVRNYQIVPDAEYKQAVKVSGKNLMPIAAYNPYDIPSGANIGETLLKKYISHPGSQARMIRSGVEFVTPELSRGLAKGVTIDDLNSAIDKAKIEGTKLILYFIAGLESQDDITEYFSRVILDFKTTPTVSVVYTYIDPQPFTPFHDYDLSNKIIIDAKEIYRVVSQRNKRIRVMPLATPVKSTLRTLIGRCESAQDYDYVRGLSKLSYADILGRISGNDRLRGTSTTQEIVGRKRAQVIPDYWIPGIVE